VLEIDWEAGCRQTGPSREKGVLGVSRKRRAACRQFKFLLETRPLTDNGPSGYIVNGGLDSGAATLGAVVHGAKDVHKSGKQADGV
jgi:hypothetical protein